MLSISAISDADYYLRAGSGCGSPQDGSGGAAADELEYMTRGEPPGEWYFPHRNHLGVSGEIHAEGPSGQAFRTVLNELRHPVTGEQLGRAPMRFATVEERVERFTRKNPHATYEQFAHEWIKAASMKAHANHAFDLTFSPPKSWSVLHAALQRDGRTDEAEEFAAALRAGVDAALTFAAHELGFTRRGAAGPEVAGRQTMEFVRESDFQTAVFAHHTSRERDPQLHFHVMLLNRMRSGDGQWRALYSPSILKSKHMLDAIFLRVAEAEATARLGLRFAARPDGRAREVVGVGQEVRDLFSVRVRAKSAAAQELVDAYTARYGRPPSRLVMWRMNQRATLRSRKAKPADAPTREQDLDRWDAECAAQFREGLASVLDGVDEAARQEASDGDFEPDAVIALALADLTQRKATWNRSHLMHAINAHLPDMLAIEPARVPELLSELTDAALAGRQVVSLSAAPAVKVPASLRDAKSGESVFEAPTGGRYTSATHLAREDALVARLEREGAPVLTEGSAAAVLEGHGLSAEQLAVATAILTSPRQLEFVNAPAGTGKTRVMAALSDVSERVWGHGLTGFTTAQNAAEVLARDGVSRAHNIAAYLHFRDRERRGEVTDLERAAFAVPRGATVVIDEASMVSTPDLSSLLGELDTAGVGRVVMIGDTAQVDAVDAGGAFGMLVERREPHTLAEVRRFHHEWEADASTRLRDGDMTALHQYDARARIRGGAEPEDVERDAVAAFVDDHLSGQHTVLVVSSADAADRLSSQIREDLVRAGHVSESGIALHNDTVAGVGDIIATRQNDRRVGVVNREVWQVVSVDEAAGTMQVRPREQAAERCDSGPNNISATADDAPDLQLPAPITLPAAYVAEHVELAYASTVEAVQGRTTDTGHVLVDDLMGRSRLYPALTRGREANTAWVPVTPPPRRAHEYDDAYAARIPSAMSAMVAALEREDHAEAARTVAEAEQARATNLGHLGPQWQTLVAEHRALDHLDVLHEVLGEGVHAVAKDPALDGVLHLVRAAEVAGHDPRQVVANAAVGLDLEGARSPAAVLYNRIDGELAKLPARGEHREAFTYLARTPEGTGERIGYARDVAKAMDARTAALGEQVSAQLPVWATDRLGALPDDAGERAAWQGRAAVVAAYREQYGWSHAANPIGQAPSRAEPERRWAWERAADVLGFSESERNLAEASDAELGSRVLTWRRELDSMPRNVDADLREAHLARGQARREVVAARTRGEDTTVAEAEASMVDARVERLELVATARAREVERTERVRGVAQEALGELDRRVARDRAAMERAEAERADERAAEQEKVDVEDRVHEAVGERFREQYVRGAPTFGSQRWAELGDDEPEKRASIFTAALGWWRAGNPRDEQELTERLEQHGAERAPDYERLTQRGFARIREHQMRPREADFIGPMTKDEHERSVAPVPEPERDEPTADPEVLAEVHRVTGRDLEGHAPEFGSSGYADADPPTRGKAETRAALRWWHLGDDLDERAARADGLDHRQAAKAISQEMQEHRHPWDNRTRAEVARARGEEPLGRPIADDEPEKPEREEPARPDVSWMRQAEAAEKTAPERGDDLAEQVARAKAAMERLTAAEHEREAARPAPDRGRAPERDAERSLER